jgi:hypothetical protein
MSVARKGRPRTQISESTIERAYRRYVSGPFVLAQIATETGVSEEWLRLEFHRRGFAVKGRGQKQHTMAEDDDDDVYRMPRPDDIRCSLREALAAVEKGIAQSRRQTAQLDWIADEIRLMIDALEC